MHPPHRLSALVLLSWLSLPSAWGATSQNNQNSSVEVASGADSRAGRWTKQRLRRIEEILPEKPHTVEKLFMLIDRGVAPKSRQAGFFPDQTVIWDRNEETRQTYLIGTGGLGLTLGRVIPESGPALGFRYQRGESGLGMLASGALSSWDYRYVTLQLGDISQDDKFFVHTDFRYRFLPQENFYGIGNEARRGNRTDYLLEDRFYGGVAGYRFTPWLRAAVRVGYLDLRLGRGRDERLADLPQVFQPGSLPGDRSGPDFLQFDSFLFIDWRDIPGKPHKGSIVSAQVSRFDDRGRRDFEFTRLALESRHFFELLSPERVVAFRLFASMDDPSGSGQVPFYLQQSLGGANLLRGFPHQRFRDRNLVYASAEYRWEPAAFLQLVLFYDAGKVFSDWSRFDRSGHHDSWGGGIRITSQESVIFRIDVGRSNEGTRLIFGLGPSF